LAETLDALVLDLLEWIGPQPRAYAEVMEAWRTSCPRLTVWEDANERGFVERRNDDGRGALVSLTPLGRDFLARHRGEGAFPLDGLSRSPGPD
jgi:hypothetical protein